MKDMIEKIRYAKFEPNRPVDSEIITFIKICFGQNFINKKLHFSDKTGLKIQVSIRFSKEFLLHRLDLVASDDLVKKKFIISNFCFSKFFKI